MRRVAHAKFSGLFVQHSMGCPISRENASRLRIGRAACPADHVWSVRELVELGEPTSILDGLMQTA